MDLVGPIINNKTLTATAKRIAGIVVSTKPSYYKQLQKFVEVPSYIRQFVAYSCIVLCMSRADLSQAQVHLWTRLEWARVSWHSALGGSNRGLRADSNSRLEHLGGSWWFLGGSRLESRVS